MRRANTATAGSLAALACTLSLAGAASAAEQLQIVLPLGRIAYQTNESIDLSVVRSSAEALPSETLSLKVTGADGSAMSFAFPVRAAALEKPDSRSTEHLHLNGRLLRPGAYSIGVACGAAQATAQIDVFSHVRRSDFKLLQWGSRAEKKEQSVIGEDGMGYNLIYAAYGGLSPDEMIRGRADYMWCCTMGGAHQMDLRQECDWSDPYVLQGGEARVVQRALRDRTMPNCLGVHFYDEPGLTWMKNPRTGVMSPFNIPAQDRSYRSAFGEEPPQQHQVKADDAQAVARWNHLGRWKESFMEAAWKDARFGVDRVQAGFLSTVQSQYGWMAYSDGYYFNVVRSLDVMSGHGGYDDGPATYFYPSFYHEMGRVRDLNKPIWYLPCWYGENSDDLRLEQYLSFMMNLQGMATPPDFAVQKPQSCEASAGIVESNKLMARLGTIFTTMRVTRPPVAMLYSLSQDLGAQVHDMQDTKDLNKAAYEGGGHPRAKLEDVYLAGKMLHVGIFPVVEEDVLDGTLAANHKAVILPGVNYLEPRVVSALEAYAAAGGAVLLTDDCKVQIKGAQKIGAVADTSIYDKLSEIWAKDQKESMRLRRPENYLKQVEPLAAAMKQRFAALGIKPEFDADSQYIVTSRQAAGDVEYLFAVNATPKPDADKAKSQPATARLFLPADGRPVYDAVHGQPEAGFKADGDRLSGSFVFGAGAMRVFARTARPIGAVAVATPVLFRDMSVNDTPIRIEFTASVQDDRKQTLSGSIPMQVRVIDSLGQVRYDLYRATDHGVLRLDLPLAANDPAGDWKILVRELLGNTEGANHFAFAAGSQCGALVGATPRAISFGADRENIFRLSRTQQDVTIVRGTSEYNTAAAERVAGVLKPWGVQCKILTAAEANKPRSLTADEAATWAGLEAGKVTSGEKNDPRQVGFSLRGPAILIGTPEDNPLIKFALDAHMLSYKPDAASFPGRGRGYIGWQRDSVGYRQESVTLIAYDGAGMAEAVGSFYEAVAGLEPLTHWEVPSVASVTPAARSTALPEATVAWRAIAPDRVERIAIDAKQITVTTADGSVTQLNADGTTKGQGAGAPGGAATEAPKVPDSLAKAVLGDRVVKRVASNGTLTAIGYWGGTVQICDSGTGAVKTLQVLPADVGDIGWVEGNLVVGLSDGTVVALKP